MATLAAVMAELKSKGSEQYRKTYARHGIPIEKTFGVSNAHLKTIAKGIKGEQALAMELFATGNMDAMYLAGIIADGKKMTSKELQAWAEGADGMRMISEYTVPWVAVENADGAKMAVKWMASKKEGIATTGWSTYAGLVSAKADAELDLKEVEGLLNKVVKEIKGAPNRVKYTMNSFVICVGCYVKPLAKQAKAVAKQIGVVEVDMGETACKIPLATEYIAKVEGMGRAGVKKKTIRC